MRFRLDYVPATLPDAITEVLNGLSEDERAHILSLNSSELASLHPTLGTMIRGAWSLWDGETALARDCRARGLPAHPDDIALAIIQEAWGELCDK